MKQHTLLILVSALVLIGYGIALTTKFRQQTLWNHRCTQPGNDATLCNLGTNELVWWCGCGKSGTNYFTNKIVVEERKLREVARFAVSRGTAGTWRFEKTTANPWNTQNVRLEQGQCVIVLQEFGKEQE